MAETKRVSAFRNAGLKKNRITKKETKERVSAFREDEKNKGGLLEGAGYLAGNLGLGAAGIAEGIGDVLSAGGDLLRGDTAMAKYRFLDNQTADAQRKLQESYNPGTIMKGAGDVASGIGNSLVFMIPYAGPYLAATGYWGQGISNAAEKTGDVGLKEIGYGVLSGGMEFGLEAATAGIGGVAKNIGASVIRNTGKEAVEATGKAIGRRAVSTMGGSIGKEIAKGFFGEAIEEMASEALDPVLQKFFKIDENAETSLENVLYAGLIGGLSGGLMTAGPAAINYASAKKTGQTIREKGEAQELLDYAKLLVNGANRFASKSAPKAEAPEGAGKLQRATTGVRNAATGVNRWWTANGATRLANTLQKNISAYEAMLKDPKVTADKIKLYDAVLGELRGNTFLLEADYLLDTYEDMILKESEENRQAVVNEINERMARSGAPKRDYTLEDLKNNEDGILTSYATAIMREEISDVMKKRTGKKSPGKAPEAAEEAPKAAEAAPDVQTPTQNQKPTEREFEGDEGILRKSAKGLGLSDVETDMMVTAFKRGTSMDEDTFSKAFAEGVYYGRQNRRAEDVSKNTLFGTMSEAERSAAIEAGRIGAKADTERRAALAAQKTAPAPKEPERVRLELKDGIPMKQRGDRAYSVYNAGRIIGSALNADVVIHDTLGEKNGRKLNGYFNRGDNTIHVALDAGKDADGTALYTLAHEVTHYVREWSPEKYQVLSDFIGERMSARGEDLDAMIATKKELLKNMEEFKDLSDSALTDAAYEEVISDAMETVLSDGKVLQELADRDKSLWETVKAWIREAIARLKAAYAELKPNSQAAKVLTETMDSFTELERLFTEGVTAAGERAKGAEVETEVSTAEGKKYSTTDYYVLNLNDSDIERYYKTGKTGHVIHNKDKIREITGSAVLRSDSEIESFVNESINESNGLTKGYAVVPKALSDKIADFSNNQILTENWFLELSSDDLFHLYREHHVAKENGDLDMNANEVSLVTKKLDGNADVLAIERHKTQTKVKLGIKTEQGAHYVVVELVSSNSSALRLKNAWKVSQEKYQSLKKGEHKNAPNRTNNSPAISDSSRLSDNMIPQEPDSVNRKFSISDENVSAETAEAAESAADTNVGDTEEVELSDRDLLLAMAEQMVGTEEEYKIVADYKAGYDGILAKQERADELSDRQRELQGVMFTGADAEARSNAAKELKVIRDELNNLLDEVAKEDKKLAAIEGMKAIRNLITRERLNVRDTFKTKYEGMYKQKVEAKATADKRRQVRRIYNRVNRLLFSPTKTRNVPIGLQGLVAEALKAANMDVDAMERLAQLEEQLSKLEREAVTDEKQIRKLEGQITEQEKKVGSIKEQTQFLIELLEATNNPDADGETRLVFDAEVLQKLKDLQKDIGKASVRGMDLKQLTALKDFYDLIHHRITKANNLLASERKISVNELGEKASGEAASAKELTFLSPKGMELAGAAKIRTFFWKNMKPTAVFEAIGSDTFKELFRAVLDGEDVWAKDILEAREKILELKKAHGYDKWNVDERKTVKTSAGDVQLSISQIMSLYAYSFRDQAKSHLMGGGFVIDPNATTMAKGKKLKYVDLERRLNDSTRYTMSEENIDRMYEYLTEEQKAYVKEMQAYLTSLGKKGNEVSRKLYGIDIFKEDFYFPIKVKSEYLESELGKTGDPKIKNRGMTKELTPKAKNPLVLQDFMDVAVEHINSMATYHAFVLPMEDLTRVLNFKPTNFKRDADGNVLLDDSGKPVADEDAAKQYDTLKAVIEAKYGADAVKYIEQLIRDLNGGARRDSAAGIIDRGITAFKRASTMASLSVLVQQPTSFVRAMAYVEPKYFKNLAGLKMTEHKKLWERVKKYAPVALIKEMGGYDTGVGARTGDYLNATKYGKGERLKGFVKDENYRAEVLGVGAAYADEMAWIHIFEACVNEQADKLGKSKDSEEVLQAAGKRFEEVIRHTQVYDSTLTRSEYMRSKDTGSKMFTAFMAEPSTVVSMVAEAIVKAERGNTKFLRDTAAAVAGSIILNALLSSLVYAMRDDDEDKSYGEKYLSTLAMETAEGFNPAEYLPYARDIMSLIKGYEIERSDMSLIGDLVNSIRRITSSQQTVGQKMQNVGGAVAAFFGLPVANVTREVNGLVFTFLKSVDTERFTGKGLSVAMKEEFDIMFGLWDDETTNGYQLYQSAIDRDGKHFARVAARYETDKEVEMALRKALRSYDPRINEAAMAKMEGELEVYEDLIGQIVGEGNFDRNITIRAVNNEILLLKSDIKRGNLVPEDPVEEETPESIYTASDLNDALERGEAEDFTWIYHTLMAYKQEQGKTEAQARSSIKSSVTSYWKKRYTAAWEENNSAEMRRILKLLLDTGLYGNHNATATTLEGWVKAYAKAKRK